MVKILLLTFQQCLVPFTMLLVKGRLKRESIDIYLIIFLGDRNFGNTSAMRVMFFFENIQNLIFMSKVQKKIEKTFFFLEIIAYELAALNCLY